MMVRNRLTATVLAGLGVALLMAGCSSEATGSSPAVLSTLPGGSTEMTEHGSCDVQQTGIETPEVSAYTEINANYPSFVVTGDVGEGAKISITGPDRCVWIKGSILKEASIRVEGDGATIIVEGSVDLESSINVAGKNSLIWLKDSTMNMPNNSSVTGALGGEYCLGPNRSCISA